MVHRFALPIAFALSAAWLGTAATAATAQATAHASSTQTPTTQVPSFNTPVGVGSLVGRSEGENDYALVIEGQNHFTQRRGMYNLRQYGHGESRLELGTGVGVNLSATSGVTLLGVRPGQAWSPHLGIEPFSGRIALNTDSSRERYYQWLPMASVGLQFAGPGSCRFLPLVRAGGGFGNMGKEGLAPVARAGFGAGSYLNCARFDGAAELTRLVGSGNNLHLATVDLAHALRPRGLEVGLRAESDLARGGDSSMQDRTEQRVLLLLRGELMSFD